MPRSIIANALRQQGEGGFRSVLAAIAGAIGLDRQAARSAAFTAALVSLSAKLSISDGVALQIEADAFERVFHIDDEDLRQVRRLFDLAKQDVAGFESYARTVGEQLAGEPDLKRDVFDALFHVATADGVLHEGENRYLERVAKIFGYAADEFQSLRARFVHVAGDPYVVLGMSRDATDAELRAHYRRLVKDNHPDTLIGHGAPRYAVDVATRKLAGINAAWEVIAKERRL